MDHRMMIMNGIREPAVYAAPYVMPYFFLSYRNVGATCFRLPKQFLWTGIDV